MKKLLSFTLNLAILLFAPSTFAWETLVSCDGGKFIIEKECYSGPSEYGSPDCYSRRTQLVVRNPSIQNLFAEKRAYGYYQHAGEFYGYQSAQFPEMIINIDNIADWGFSGSFNYALRIPYREESVNISYYVNFLDRQSISVKAIANTSSAYDIIKKGERASVEFHDCWFK